MVPDQWVLVAEPSNERRDRVHRNRSDKRMELGVLGSLEDREPCPRSLRHQDTPTRSVPPSRSGDQSPAGGL